MKKHLLSALLVAAGATTVNAQTFPTAWGNRMQTVLDSINTRNGNMAGVTAAIYMPGMGLWTGVTGISSPGVPMNKGMRVLIGSNSKLFMAATMLKLQEQGRLSLNDRIGRWIHIAIPTVDTTATIRQLLMHESGMADYYADRVPEFFDAVFADTSRMFTPKDMVDSSGAPVYPKGRGHHYSNGGYALCAMIIKEATGQDYWQNLRTLILNPLQMDSTFAPLHEPYQPISGSNFYGEQYTGYGFTSLMSSYPGAGDIASTPQEMVQWYQNIFGGNVLSAASLQELKTIEPASQYGLGIQELVSQRLGGIYYHGGWVGAFTSEAYYDKDTKASMFIALNTYNDTMYTGQYMAPLLDVFTKEMAKQPNDAGITGLLSPRGVTCNASVTPVVTLKNNGSSPLTSAVISVRIDNNVVTNHNWNGSLAPDASISVTLPATPMSNGMHKMQIYTTMPNGVADIYNWNDTFNTKIGANLTTAYNGYFNEGFENATTPVLIWNSKNGTESLAGISHLAGYNSTHSVASSNFSDYGNVSNIDLPAVRLTPGSSPMLQFRYAYAINSNGADSLQALISTDCGVTWTSLFHKGNPDLGTGDTTNAPYYPQTAAKWKDENISLSSYNGEALIRFRMFNGYGNIMFLDNIAIGAPTSVSAANLPTMSVFPNPAHNQVYVKDVAAKTPIRLTDVTGRILSETISDGSKITFDISELAPGMYLIASPYNTTKIVKH